MARLYPRVHSLELEVVGGGSLLFRWPGRDPAVDPPSSWRTTTSCRPTTCPVRHGLDASAVLGAELVGEGAERRIWGRGAIDDKGMLASILEAVEDALAEGVTPAGDIYLSLGHNEETQGAGAEAIVDLLALARHPLRTGDR